MYNKGDGIKATVLLLLYLVLPDSRQYSKRGASIKLVFSIQLVCSQG